MDIRGIGHNAVFLPTLATGLLRAWDMVKEQIKLNQIVRLLLRNIEIERADMGMASTWKEAIYYKEET